MNQTQSSAISCLLKPCGNGHQASCTWSDAADDDVDVDDDDADADADDDADDDDGDGDGDGDGNGNLSEFIGIYGFVF